MKVYSLFLFLLALIIGGQAQAVSCLDEKNNECDYYAKSNGNQLIIYSKVNGKPLFLRPLETSATESISFYKSGDKYTILKESTNSDKNKELLSFSIAHASIDYIYLSADVDFNNNERYWHGVYCTVSNGKLGGVDDTPFIWAVNNLCHNAVESSKGYKYIGKDLYFSIDRVSEHKHEKMNLIALNAKDSDNVNVNNFGCISNCLPDSFFYRFTGKIDGKYTIKSELEIIDGEIKGFYFYDKVRVKIPLAGKIDNGNVILNAVGENDAISEVFSGHFDGNKINGIWKTIKNNKSYPFVLYMSLN